MPHVYKDRSAVRKSTSRIVIDFFQSALDSIAFRRRSSLVTVLAAYLLAMSGCQFLKAPVRGCKDFDPACLRRCSVRVGMSKDQVRALLLKRPEQEVRPAGALALEEVWGWYWGFVSFGRDGRVEFVKMHWESCPTETQSAPG